MKNRIAWIVVVAGVGLVSAAPSQAVPIFSKTPSSDVSASKSDLGQDRFADSLMLGEAATAQSVTWRGIYGNANTLTFPLSFDLTLYSDAAGLPGAVLSNTPVSFNALAEITDTGADVYELFDVYEFQADLTPTLLAAGTPYWFSPLADTNNDVDDDWFWTTGLGGDAYAFKFDADDDGPWRLITDSSSFPPSPFGGPFYFILDDEPLAVPEPTTAMLAAAGVLALASRRRRADKRDRSAKSEIANVGPIGH